MELNQQQVAAWLKVALASGGPVYDFALKKLGISQGDYAAYSDLAAYVLPPLIIFIWTWVNNRRSAQVAKVASFTPAQQAEALAKTPDDAKIQIAEAVPDVATVVVKNGANGKIAALAASDAHPNVVTEAQNAADVKAGKRGQ